MLTNQELINKVKDYFDLNIYETKVWLALITKGIASAGEIAEISGVPRSRTYDVLEGLEKKGFAIVKLGKPVKYIGVKPKMILEKIKNNVKQNADEKIKSLAKIRETTEYEALESLYNEGINPIKREEISAAIKGKSNIANYLREILMNAKKEVVICTNAKNMIEKFVLFKQTIDLLNENGIKVEVALSGEKELVDKISKKLNKKVKYVQIDARFFIVDKEQILFYITKNPDDEFAIWLNSDFFSKAFRDLFEMATKA